MVEVAHKKHGGSDGLEEKRRQNMDAKVTKRVTKRKEEARKARAACLSQLEPE